MKSEVLIYIACILSIATTGVLITVCSGMLLDRSNDIKPLGGAGSNGVFPSLQIMEYYE